MFEIRTNKKIDAKGIGFPLGRATIDETSSFGLGFRWGFTSEKALRNRKIIRTTQFGDRQLTVGTFVCRCLTVGELVNRKSGRRPEKLRLKIGAANKKTSCCEEKNTCMKDPFQATVGPPPIRRSQAPPKYAAVTTGVGAGSGDEKFTQNSWENPMKRVLWLEMLTLALAFPLSEK